MPLDSKDEVLVSAALQLQQQALNFGCHFGWRRTKPVHHLLSTWWFIFAVLVVVASSQASLLVNVLTVRSLNYGFRVSCFFSSLSLSFLCCCRWWSAQWGTLRKRIPQPSSETDKAADDSVVTKGLPGFRGSPSERADKSEDRYIFKEAPTRGRAALTLSCRNNCLFDTWLALSWQHHVCFIIKMVKLKILIQVFPVQNCLNWRQPPHLHSLTTVWHLIH